MTDDLYPKFSRDRLYEQVASHVEDLVSTGKLQVGDRLPPERELAERLGVARGVVREALKVLAVKGLVTVEPGRGTFVADVDIDSVSEHLARLFRMGKMPHIDLIEFRKILEIEMAELAARRATPENLVEMKQAIADMDRHISSPEEYIAADLNFHLALAKATRNGMFPLLIEVVVDLLQQSRRLIFRVAGAPERGQHWHRLIHEAIEAGDTGRAREAMRQHLEQVANDASAGGRQSPGDPEIPDDDQDEA
jgi:GntR family transcriptional repressor for pyruvate dehydrogenase complex